MRVGLGSSLINLTLLLDIAFRNTEVWQKI